MFNKIQLQNFKSISNEEPLELSNCTILCGANSSGKSSLIQAILMMSQTITSRYNNNTMLLNSYLTRLGSFQDIKSSFSDDNEIQISLQIAPEHSYVDYLLEVHGIESIDFKLKFSSYNTKKLIDVETDVHPSITEIEIMANLSNSVKQHIHLVKQDDQEIGNLYTIIDSQYFLDKINKEYPDAEIVGCTTNGPLPDKLYIEYDYHKFSANLWLDRLLSMKQEKRYSVISFDPKILILEINKLINKEINDFEENLALRLRVARKKYASLLDKEKFSEEEQNRILELFIRNSIPQKLPSASLENEKRFLGHIKQLNSDSKDALFQLIKRNKERLIANYTQHENTILKRTRTEYLIREFRDINQSILSYFEHSIKYLGPLRNDPQPIYLSLGLVDPMNVGLKGEFSAAVLHINRNREIKYPIFDNVQEDIKEVVFKHGKLAEACEYWLQYLGIIQSIKTEDHGKLGYGVTVKSNSASGWHDLTHVGVGVSQVLPIILMSLLSKRNDTLIFEQPELHLHPKVQSLLGDFFLAMIAWDRQCIIESHSEYIINKLRFKIIQDESDQLNKKIAIYFIEKNNLGCSFFKKIKINKYGAIHDWPKDFFDQSDNDVEAILVAANKKRMAEKKVQTNQD